MERGERVLQGSPLRPEEGHGELVHLRIVLGPVGLAVRDHAELAEPGDVVRVDHLQVGDVVPGVPGPVRGPGRLARVQGVADRPIADRVHVDLEASRVQRDHGLDQLLAIEIGDPRLIGHVAGRVAVGPEHRPRVVLEHAVAHDLHGGGMEGAHGASVATRHELVDLLGAAMPVPPERPDHASGEVTALGE